MVLSSALKDIRWQVRLAATEALEEIGGAGAVPSLIAALDDSSWNIRKAAVRALVAIYQGHKLDHQTNQQILALRAKIVNSHRDNVSCNWHFDQGIGMDFPL
jgi:HEAT repeat protein